MARSASLKLLLVTVATLTQVTFAVAQSAPDGPLVTPPPKQPAPKTEIAPRTRAISPEVAAQLSAAVPKFTPPAPKPALKVEGELPDLREIDKPKNN
ncbi:MAG: hypothetical protein ABIZ49_13840, partial [Opitutaceae bacterium]